MKKQNLFVLCIVVFFLVLSVGYSIFSETVTINGTATAKGNFDVEFTSIGEIESVGYTKKGLESQKLAQISDDKNTLRIIVNSLDFPGAYVIVPVTVTNVGSIPAVLESVEENNLNVVGRAIKVSYEMPSNESNRMSTGDSYVLKIKVEWDPDVNARSENAEFNLKLNYSQITNNDV